MPAPPKANWLAVRTYYLAGHSVAECAKKFGLSTRQIERRRSNEDWAQVHARNVAEASEAVASFAREELVETLKDHIAFADRLMEIAIQGEEDLKAMSPGRSRIEARKALIESAERAVKVAREVRGLKVGVSSNESAEADGGMEIVKTVVAAEPIAASA